MLGCGVYARQAMEPEAAAAKKASEEGDTADAVEPVRASSADLPLHVLHGCGVGKLRARHPHP